MENLRLQIRLIQIKPIHAGPMPVPKCGQNLHPPNTHAFLRLLKAIPKPSHIPTHNQFELSWEIVAMPYDRNAWIANAQRIECSADNFQRFEWDTNDRDKHAAYYGLMFWCLKDCSDKRAMHRGHDGLMIDAARKYVRFVQHLAEQYYAERGHVVRWSERDLKAVAAEIAERTARNPVFKNHANAWLENCRSNIYVKPEVMAEVQGRVTWFDPKRNVNKDKWHIDDGDVECKSEEPIDTFTRTLDYFEHIRHLPGYPSLYPIKRELTSLVRVANSLLD